MPQTTIKANSPIIKQYYLMLQEAKDMGALHEGNVRRAFETLLRETANTAVGWKLTTELTQKRDANNVRYDGVLEDEWLVRGIWEAKDTKDNLSAEIRLKIGRGYPLENIIFEDTQTGVLFQDKQEVMRADLRQPDELAELLNRFYSYNHPIIEEFHEAVATFQDRVPQIARNLKDKIEAAHKDNQKFKTAYQGFMELCRVSLNPNIAQAAVDEMLIQHMLTERLIRKVFNVEEFTRRNVIAAEVEKVIDALSSHHFNRRDFLGSLDYFYTAIENAAETRADFSDKQKFINHVYERFFQGYSVKVADTHGIVYTPQEIVDFMCAAIEEVLQNEFGKKLGDKDVTIIDPATGTGNFVVNLLRRAAERNRRNLEQFYRECLFANEVMLMPYYIASLNIEHEYFELTKNNESFEGICFVDTLDLAENVKNTGEGRVGSVVQTSFIGQISEKNAERVERQKAAPITVIIANPPYNVGQMDENDNNKNRKYEVIDRRVKDTYSKDSKATSKSKLDDPYVKFFRWATDRLQGRDGIVCFVSNSGFIDKKIYDGMRKHILEDFSQIYIVDLKGDIRKDSMREGIALGEKHTVFGLAAMVGISISVLVRNHAHTEHKLHYTSVDWRSTREEKFEFLREHLELEGKENVLNTIVWENLVPDKNHTWLVPENADEFNGFLSIGSKETKGASGLDAEAVFKVYSLGVSTNRDEVVYNFSLPTLDSCIKQFIDNYNAEVDRYRRSGVKINVDDFVHYDNIKWSRDLKLDLQRHKYAEFEAQKLRQSQYRPFCKKYLFHDPILNEEPRLFNRIFPNSKIEGENLAIIIGGYGRKEFATSLTNVIHDLNFYADPAQCFPFYIYDPDGTNRRENITDWALAQFRAHYGDESITKWDIFYYVYGLLHHPDYRVRYADNLKRELPRIPFAPEFRPFCEAGKALADLHLNYETVEPFKLDWETQNPVSYRVEKMRLNKDKTALQVNDTLTLKGIPAEVFEYRLGNRSALDWVIDQYQVTKDKGDSITSDPNSYSEDEYYIVDLVGRVVRVSVETVGIVNSLKQLPFRD